ncbi:transketolase [Roseibium sp.]|uniref:transketolase n=1 Tax=Roseibium sp. TaxID=1936156 RepID=UPI003B5199F5
MPINPTEQELANVIRGLAIDAVEAAGHGHPGAAMGMADIALGLYSKHLKFSASSPTWHDRDRVILSNGHAAIFLYSLLWLTGVPGIELEDLKSFRKGGSITPGHPEYGHTPGVETTTGPLGQGLGMAVGFAMAERRLREEYGEAICDHRTWVFAGDGCLMEGVGQEAVSLAGHLGLGHLNLLYDMNGITIDGNTDLAFTEDTASKFKALGWHVLEADGHDHSEIDRALGSARNEIGQPSIVLFRTTIGKGAPTKSGSSKIHGSPLGVDEARVAKEALGLPAEPFEIDDQLLSAWRSFGTRSDAEREAWHSRVDALPERQHSEFHRRQSSQLPAGLFEEIEAQKVTWIEERPAVATRKASQLCLEVLTRKLPELIGGSADLTGSNLTKTNTTETTFSRSSSGRYINYGVREFAMGAAMNGLALHGGVRPYGGTFMVFSDYMRNAIRLSALMQTNVLYILTHDSIGLGEDGPTHQPVEHLASLRAIPGLAVYRPADVVETMEAYETVLATGGPAVFALSRQNTPLVRDHQPSENLVSKGGYIIRDVDGPRDITLLATGTEVALALGAADMLLAQGIKAAVVSMPCWSLFEAQSAAYRSDVLGQAPKLAIEAATPFGWARYTGSERNVIGVTGFGASASVEELYQMFGLTPENITSEALRIIIRNSKPYAA